MALRLSSNASFALLTRVRAQYGMRLREAEYTEMASSKTVPEAASFLLHRTAYGSFMTLGDEVPTRGLVEYQLRKALLERSILLCRTEKSVGNCFFEYVLLRNGVNELLGFLRCQAAGQPERYMYSTSVYPMAKNSPFALEGLARVRTREELIDCLHGTHFEKILTPVLKMGDRVDIALAEAVLDRDICTYMQQKLRAELPNAQAKTLLEILYAKAELSDAEMLYRAKTSYQISQTMLRAMQSGYRFRFSQAELEAMLHADSGQEVKRIVQASKYGKYLKSEAADDPGNWSDRFLSDMLCRYIHFSAEPSVVLFAYLNWMELEIKNLIYVVEGVRYRLTPDEIISMLLLPAQERR